MFGPLGSRTLTLAVDTASTYSTIPAAFSRSVGIVSAPAREVPIVTASGTIRAATAVADTLAAFGLRRTQFTVVIVDLPRVGEVTGLLGLDFFADRKLCFDFAAGDLELS